MTEKEYIECIKKAYGLSKKEIEEDLEMCRQTALKEGVDIEEVYDRMAVLAHTITKKTKTYDRHYFSNGRAEKE